MVFGSSGLGCVVVLRAGGRGGCWFWCVFGGLLSFGSWFGVGIIRFL